MTSIPRPIYVILGSGGHTSEMCKIMKSLLVENEQKELYSPVRYIVAKSDSASRRQIRNAMTKLDKELGDESFIEVPRSREVGQSWFSTVFTTLWSLFWSLWLIWRDQPRLILCNGPGTCVPFCYAAYAWRKLGRLSAKTRIVFVESLCRIRSLSLSGKLLMPITDMFVIQWESLAADYTDKSNVYYFGRIM